MENNKDKKDLTSKQEKELFSNLEFSYSKSKEQVWDALDAVISDESEGDVEGGEIVMEVNSAQTSESKFVKTIAINWRSLSVAASIVVLLSAGLFARFYTRTVSVAAGEFVSHTLPDGSEVQLNAASSIAYHPFWWRVDRGVTMQGEAYFVVAKGEKFSVFTDAGTVEVLGTEFNVYAREDNFQVYCEEGRVKVTGNKSMQSGQDNVVLTRGNLVTLEPIEKKLVKHTEDIPETAILSWRRGEFIYNTTPALKVFGDIERHYGIKITLSQQKIKKKQLTASFSRTVSVEGALEALCIPNQLSFLKNSDGVYLIQSN